jgi:hypothetical protein
MNINEHSITELAKVLLVEPAVLKAHIIAEGAEPPTETKIGEALEGFNKFLDNTKKERYDAGRYAAIGIPVQMLHEQLLGEKKEFRFERYEDAAAQAKAIADAYAEKKLKETGQEPDKRITTLNADLEQLRLSLKTKEDELVKANAKVAEVEQFGSINSVVIAAAAGIPLAAEDDTIAQQQRDEINHIFHRRYKVEVQDGKQVVIDRATGQVRKNNLLEPVTIKSVVEEVAAIFPKKSAASGRGDGTDTGGNITSLKGLTKEQINKHIESKGLSLVGEEGKALYRQWLKENPEQANK